MPAHLTDVLIVYTGFVTNCLIKLLTSNNFLAVFLDPQVGKYMQVTIYLLHSEDFSLISFCLAAFTQLLENIKWLWIAGILDLYLTLVGNTRVSPLSTMIPGANTVNLLSQQPLWFPPRSHLRKKRAAFDIWKLVRHSTVSYVVLLLAINHLT